VDDLLAVSRLIMAVPLALAGFGGLWAAARRKRVGVIELAEATVAVLLLYGATAWWGTVVALGLLVVAAVLATVEATRDSASPAGVPRIVRSVALAIPAFVVVREGPGNAGPDLSTWLAGLSTVQQVTVVGLGVGLATLVCGVRRSVPDEAPATSLPATSLPATLLAAPALVRSTPALTIGMATYDDFDGVYFTLQALRLYHDLADTELLVVDNYGCQYTKDLVSNWAGGTYLLATDIVGTAAARDLVFSRANGSTVLCCDSHVLFEPGAIARLRQFYVDNPECTDLLQGPMVYDDGRLIATHFEPVWRDQMWGTWATDERGYDRDGEPFDIPMQGLGAFACRTDTWPGFHPEFRGFGGEEGYIHEKFRRAGRRCLCVPWLRWMHRFGRPKGTPYPLTVEAKLRNYVIGHSELGLDLSPVLEHFSQYIPADRVAHLAEQALIRVDQGRIGAF
jgi:hypothetical protein